MEWPDNTFIKWFVCIYILLTDNTKLIFSDDKNITWSIGQRNLLHYLEQADNTLISILNSYGLAYSTVFDFDLEKIYITFVIFDIK